MVADGGELCDGGLGGLYFLLIFLVLTICLDQLGNIMINVLKYGPYRSWYNLRLLRRHNYPSSLALTVKTRKFNSRKKKYLPAGRKSAGGRNSAVDDARVKRLRFVEPAVARFDLRDCCWQAWLLARE
ncbi:laccase-14 [Dorcoceras hygrometricum]|uniref:Laccase-14 n=1 Tax=Dorcoceras hygrometricum TaxID=472368 RepID=A0A2Z7C529_9LAMI|nr:laccase-14 [Dorcoceras hygrometricum]